VINQTYQNWELCIVDDASNDPALIAYLTKISLEEPRIKCHFSSTNNHISETSNQAIAMCSGSFVALLDHDDELSPYALAFIVREIARNPSIQLIYSDEDKLNSAGIRYEPYFKCDWNYELFLGQNMISHLGVYNIELIRSIGGFRKGYEGSQDYDLALRCIEKISAAQIVHIPKVLYHWRVLPGSTALNIIEKPYAITAAENALNDHLQRIGKKGFAEYIHFGYRIEYELIEFDQVIDVFISHNNADVFNLTTLCSRLAKNFYVRKIFVISQALDKDYLQGISDKVNFIETSRNLQIQAIFEAFDNNCESEFALFLNEHALIDEFDNRWLKELLLQINNSGSTLVAGSSFNNKNYLISGPQFINKSGFLVDLFNDYHESNGGYFGRMQLTQRVSAVSMDCVLGSKTKLMNHLKAISIECLRSTIQFHSLISSNKEKIIWTPFSKIKINSSSKINSIEDNKRNPFVNFVDPFYSPNFSDGNTSFLIDPNPQ
jgi:glycosyltransferase involved in cell wall biosynthesis